ncbi:hypothetical protein [Piscirickettsia salmonis]|nr:hypothetical protein [Piscirickettsia salmonis]
MNMNSLLSVALQMTEGVRSCLSDKIRACLLKPILTSNSLYY